MFSHAILGKKQPAGLKCQILQPVTNRGTKSRGVPMYSRVCQAPENAHSLQRSNWHLLSTLNLYQGLQHRNPYNNPVQASAKRCLQGARIKSNIIKNSSVNASSVAHGLVFLSGPLSTGSLRLGLPLQGSESAAHPTGCGSLRTGRRA